MYCTFTFIFQYFSGFCVFSLIYPLETGAKAADTQVSVVKVAEHSPNLTDTDTMMKVNDAVH